MPFGSVAEVLDGFEAELELERELGTRVVELDRSLLKPLEAAPSPVASRESTTDNRHPTAAAADMRQATATNYDFVFLHHKMLSAGAVTMMAKIVTAMKKTPETAPIVFTGERPKAKVYVVLGGKAMNQWFPELRCSPGQWARGPKGEEVLVTYSPEYILRFGAETPSVKKIKTEMWASLKGVLRKI